MKIHIFEELDSTNNAAKDKETFKNGDVIVALRQTAGRGQRGRKWSSNEGESLTFSIVLEPSFLPARYQFLLSEAVALSVSKTLDGFGVETRIKWTNDIYVADNKICGILIENDLNAGHVSRSIVGIGINVNQRQFDDWVPNPTSLALETGENRDIMTVLQRLCDEFANYYRILEATAEQLAPKIQAEYNDKLYRRRESHIYMIPGEGEVNGIIQEVRPTGELIVAIAGVPREFQFKEIEFILKNKVQDPLLG